MSAGLGSLFLTKKFGLYEKDFCGIVMERYANRGGDSGIVGYEIGNDFIRVQFSDGSVYLYTYASASANAVVLLEGCTSLF